MTKYSKLIKLASTLLLANVIILSKTSTMEKSLPQEKSIVQKHSDGLINIKTNEIDLNYLIRKGIRGDRKILNFGHQVTTESLLKIGIQGKIEPVDADKQGWNSVTFVVTSGNNKYIAKFARGEDETAALKDLKNTLEEKLHLNLEDPKDIQAKRGLIGIAIPNFFFDIQMNGNNLKEYSLQIMRFFQPDADFASLLKRSCDEKLEIVNRHADMNLFKFLGHSIGRFQRGGIENDKKVSDKTLVHGNLFSDHIIISDYKLENKDLDVSKMDPKFSFISSLTMQYLEDPKSYMLLVDPMYLSSIEFFELRRKNFRQGTLDIFNNFYSGYVHEFSLQTLEKLAYIYRNSEKAFKSFEHAANYSESIGKDMETRQRDKYDKDKNLQTFVGVELTKEEHHSLEQQLADLHRLTFLYAYYKEIKKDDKTAEKILEDQKTWQQKWIDSGLFKKLNMESK